MASTFNMSKGGGGTASEKVVLGDLDLKILKAKSLPNMDMHHHHHGKIITSDPYVKVPVTGATVAWTRVIPNSQEPIWDEHFQVTLAHSTASVEFQVKDNDVFGAQLIGMVIISARYRFVVFTL
ncbi:Phospholipase D delta [Acorus calamus]|uniref:Phospholipase D delta n=1 Tax=Acorus calamus TaxID=4465 RepID=A0AAV9ELE3_ACOCL|nr:Phospholipase D delta [Acorus calamus]